MNEVNELGERIRLARKQKKITQKKLGEMLGKVESTVRMWELGKSTPPPEVIFTLSSQLDLDYTQLMVLAGYLDAELTDLYQSREKINNRYSQLKNRKEAAIDRLNLIEFELEKYVDKEMDDLLESERNKISALIKERGREKNIITRTIQQIDDLEAEIFEINDSIRVAFESKKIYGLDSPLNIAANNSKNCIDLEILFNSESEIFFNNKILTNNEKKKVLQIIDITLNN